MYHHISLYIIIYTLYIIIYHYISLNPFIYHYISLHIIILYIYDYIKYYIYMNISLYIIISYIHQLFTFCLIFSCIWATVNIWYIAPSHKFSKSVLSFFEELFSLSKPQLNFQKIKMSRILLSINFTGWCWPTPLKNMSSSVGSILPNWMESHKSHVPNHQPAKFWLLISPSPWDSPCYWGTLHGWHHGGRMFPPVQRLRQVRLAPPSVKNMEI